MQGSWVQISPVRPYQSMDFRVNPNLVEQGSVTQWTKQFALEYGSEINNLFRAVVETNSKRIGRLDFKRSDAIYGVDHADLRYRRASASSNKSSATPRYSRMAASIFASASASVFPWDQQPGKPGADTL